MKESLGYRGSILWNMVNYNDKTTNVSFKEWKKQLIAGDFLKDFIFDGRAVSLNWSIILHVYVSLWRS